MIVLHVLRHVGVVGLADVDLRRLASDGCCRSSFSFLCDVVCSFCILKWRGDACSSRKSDGFTSRTIDRIHVEVRRIGLV